MITATGENAVDSLIGYLSQTGTATPVLTALYNSYGTVNIVRVDAGIYNLTNSEGKFTQGKTVTNNNYDGSVPQLLDTGTLKVYYQLFPVTKYLCTLYVIREDTHVKIDISTIGAVRVPINIQSFNYITPKL